MPVVAVPGALEQNIDAAFAQEACKRAVLRGQPLELAGRDEGAGSGQVGRTAERPHQPRDAVEDRVRPALELALVEDEGARLQHQPAEDAGIAKGGRERGDGAEARPEQHAVRRRLGDAPARGERRQEVGDEIAGMASGCRNIRRAGRGSAPARRSPAGSRPRRSGCRAPPAGRRRRRSRRRHGRRRADRAPPGRGRPAGRPARPRVSPKARLSIAISSMRPAGAPRGRLHSGRS